jgi:hypothetical protein
MAKRKSKKLTIEEVSKEMINDGFPEEVPPTEEVPAPDDEITDVDFEEGTPPTVIKEKTEPVLVARVKPEGIITLQDIGDRMRVIRAKKRSSDPTVQAEGTKELKDLSDELHEQEKKMKSFFGR